MSLPKTDGGGELSSRDSSRLRHPRPLAFFTSVLALALVVAGAAHLIKSLRSRFADPGHGACWIWAAGGYGGGEPVAFYAAREFELTAPGGGRIAIAADETYLLYFNGHRVGSGGYRHRAPVDEYDVSDLLQEGVNRILVELRSSRGAGGLVAELELDGDGAAAPSRVIATDTSWRIFRRFEPELFGGWSLLEGGETPAVWSRPPTGRWRLGSTRIARATPRPGFPPPTRRRPIRLRAPQTGSWLDLPWSGRRIPPIGPKQLYDWGTAVTGYLSFDLTSAAGEPGLLFFGMEPPDPKASSPDEVVLPVPGRHHWEAAVQRRFRYLLIVGAEPRRSIEVEVSGSGLERGLTPPGIRLSGVFGLEPPRSYSKVEEDVWARLTRPRKESQTG